MSNKVFVIKAYIDEIEEGRDVSKYCSSEFKARQVAQQMKDAAHLLGLDDAFQCEILNMEMEE